MRINLNNLPSSQAYYMAYETIPCSSRTFGGSTKPFTAVVDAEEVIPFIQRQHVLILIGQVFILQYTKSTNCPIL